MNKHERKNNALGMSLGKASYKLKQEIMFDLMKQLNQNQCFRCGFNIERTQDLSIDHKTDWLHSNNSIGLFFDLSNIAFSHRKCNRLAQKPITINWRIGKSGIKGVTYTPYNNKSKPWTARAVINGKHKHVGYFKTKEEAGEALTNITNCK